MKKLSLFIVAVITLTSCSNSGSGELVGVGGTSWKEPNPYGMVYIKPGSFTMGANDQDANWAASSGQKIVSVDAFWMDETEITNREYKQFVYWVRDSIALEKLVAAEGEDSEYAVKDKKTGDLVYKKGNRPMDRENEDVKKLPKLNWNEKINWSKPKTDEQALAIDSMFYSDDESLSYTRELNGNILNYKYSWIDYNQAALRRNKFNTNKGRYESDLSKLGKGQDSADCMIKKDTAYIDPENGWIINQTKFVELKSRKDFINSRIVNIYPDTLCWIRDFTYSYNEPYTKMYFHHDGYGDYPVLLYKTIVCLQNQSGSMPHAEDVTSLCILGVAHTFVQPEDASLQTLSLSTETTLLTVGWLQPR